MNKECSILLVDDHELVLDGLTRVLETAFAYGEIVGFSDAQQVCDEIKRKNYDLYIIDLQLKGMSGFELITSIRAVEPNARIIVATMHEEVWTVNRLVEMEVDGIVLKSSASEHIVQAVNTVLSGDRYLCPRFCHLKNQYVSKYLCRAKKMTPLTVQEKLILKYIVDGYSSREMAETLSLSENTIETHRKNLFVKLDVRNVAQLVSVALQTGSVNDKFSI
ncbi:response regulator transcription factor [Proteiniphilum sp.]|uniref:response regulator transcription factor n=1 Tax=Proteiniphilum sp. TaxID=1926877 RepID=UPI00332BC6FC